MSHRKHGTRAMYVVEKCRCDDCRRAVREYERWRSKQRAYGRAAYVDATPAREHIKALQAEGMGWKRVAHAAGLDTSVLWKLLYGDPSRNLAPSKRIRQRTADAILAVTLDLAGGALVDAERPRNLIRGLVARGWSQSQLAARLGITRANFHLATCERVTAETARAVVALAEQLAAVAPPESNQRERIAASRARNYAKAQGWTPDLLFADLDADDTSDLDDVDEIAVERVLAGGDATLTRAERAEVARRIVARGGTAHDVAKALHASGQTARQLVEQITTAEAGAA